MRIVSLYLGVPAALAMMAVSMGCNWLYLSSLGKTLGVVVLLSAASIAIDVLKALAPFWLSEAWKAAKVGRGAASLVLLVFCITVSLVSAVGFLAETQTGAVDGREAVTDRHSSATAQLKDLRTQLAKASAARAVEVVELAIAGSLHDPRWASSEGCTRDALRSSRDFCRDYRALEVELGAARQAKKLRDQIAETVAKVETLKAEGGGKDPDPRAALIGRMTGFTPAEVNYAIELCLAVLVEFAAAFGLFLALEGAKNHEPRHPAGAGQRPLLEVVRGGKAKAGGQAARPRRIRFGGGE